MYTLAGIKIFYSLPHSVTVLKNDKAKFKAALRKCTHTRTRARTHRHTHTHRHTQTHTHTTL